VPPVAADEPAAVVLAIGATLLVARGFADENEVDARVDEPLALEAAPLAAANRDVLDGHATGVDEMGELDRQSPHRLGGRGRQLAASVSRTAHSARLASP
jgi:hypothetical protein